ncbi:hypothetical protein [Amycolatopsis jejuensis]|uniref:hypothetical protein n=1 Tax=Amycolatopsis jejuensis TaxID=330084 RepID=UPI0012E01181|nr:hypothetical protein [Amycolatopsis jejuensis]
MTSDRSGIYAHPRSFRQRQCAFIAVGRRLGGVGGRLGGVGGTSGNNGCASRHNGSWSRFSATDVVDQRYRLPDDAQTKCGLRAVVQKVHSYCLLVDAFSMDRVVLNLS